MNVSASSMKLMALIAVTLLFLISPQVAAAQDRTMPTPNES